MPKTRSQTRLARTEEKLPPPTHQLSKKPEILSSTLPPRPIPNCYWVTPYLLASEYPYKLDSEETHAEGLAKLNEIINAGVEIFIDLTTEEDLKPGPWQLPQYTRHLGKDLKHHRRGIPDGSTPQSTAKLRSILTLLTKAENAGKKAAVHCRSGVGRTGTVVACWLIQSDRAKDAEEALSLVDEVWNKKDGGVGQSGTDFPESPQTEEQFEFVRRFKKMKIRGC